ncbi:hypothetical protein [Planctomyces sp. SH-PL14]|uniref:hypothetical protein n=1 Tax=Planctomyces sp. SH-PL14 TaxID=1632864 RepID=UPI00078D4FA1|nr:hypothetical protein [Planctomyces sp. SH-PL14]AMV18809.1 hypothetical protein VT03_13000 [Planctomyces sp. SH-PL14]
MSIMNSQSRLLRTALLRFLREAAALRRSLAARSQREQERSALLERMQERLT